MSLELAESRIPSAAPVDTRPRTLLISFCTVQQRTLYAAHSLATLCLFTTSGPDPGELLGFWGSMVFHHARIPRKGSGKQQRARGTLPSRHQWHGNLLSRSLGCHHACRLLLVYQARWCWSLPFLKISKTSIYGWWCLCLAFFTTPSFNCEYFGVIP